MRIRLLWITILLTVLTAPPQAPVGNEAAAEERRLTEAEEEFRRWAPPAPAPATEPSAPSAAPAPAADGRLTGQAVAIDGNTLFIADETVRLWGIVAPSAEGNITAYTAAHMALHILLAETTVTCMPRGRSGGEIVAVCNNGLRDIGSAMIYAGHAIASYHETYYAAGAVWCGGWYGTYDYLHREHLARHARRGLWAQFADDGFPLSLR